MKGFGIYVKNNLLEPKHYLNMGEAVWLYLWLLDKMTSVNENGIGKVLNNKPITYELVAADLGVSRQVYVRWIKRLRDAGYIQTLRTPKGLCMVVNKAEKIFGNRSIKNDTSRSVKKPKKGSIKTNTAKPSDVSKSKQAMYQNRNIGSIKNDTSNKDNTNNNTVNTTNVVADPDKPVRYGQPGINEMFDFWAAECGFNIESRVKANRAACSNLLKKHGKDKLEQLIRGVSLTHSDQYAPSIADFSELQQKLPALLVWGRKKHGSSGVTVIS